MKNSVTHKFYKGIPTFTGSEDVNHLLSGLEYFAAISSEVVYVLDFLKRGFHFVADRDFLFCGHSADEVLSLGYDFYPVVIHKDDMPLLENMHAAILRRLYSMNDSGSINYFSFAVRMKNGSRYLMIDHKLKPVFIDEKIRYGICMLTSSVFDSPGHLRAYDNNGVDFEEYSMNDTQWRKRTKPQLNVREKAILKLFKQGKNHREIATELRIARHTLQNELSSIYKKLNVHSLVQATTYAANHHLIFNNDANAKTSDSKMQSVQKRTRKLMTPEMILRIQEKLDKGQSVNSISKQENIAESAIRYAIGKGKLKKMTKLNSQKTQ